MKSEIQDFEEKRITVYIRCIYTGILQTMGWLMELKGKGILNMDDLREFEDNLLKSNEKLRKKLAEKY